MDIINAGEFKHPIEVQRYISSIDEDGIPIEEYATILSTRAKIKNMSGYEKIIANADTGIDKKRFYIRYKKDLNLTTKDRIVYNEQSYNITYISDVEELHKYYEIVAEVVE
nr:MAG TPA: Putative head tail adaptor [Caudoviricetes sp.]